MSLISDGIQSVRAYELPCGIWVDGRYIGSPRPVLVKWHSNHSNRLHQIYVNGRFAGVTIDSQQRQEIVQIPASFEAPVRIEVFAVEARNAHIYFSSELNVPSIGSGKVKITLLRGQNLPLGAVADIFFDNGTGQMDYENALNHERLQIWPAWQDKTGLGMATFGLGDFGYDGAAAVGFAKGSFGNGRFGFDADTIEWISPPLPAGVYKFAIKITDRTGRESISETGQVTVTPAAKPAEHLNIASFNKQTNQMILNIT
ncbi:MAG: hypothetical protein A2167_02740 [Planctomycetes bacterium RBG_13_46_10]|nr:MAG: hypothetical protein A2167_02740 [Planctomycetes bacterium RBG_13_46_10]